MPVGCDHCRWFPVDEQDGHLILVLVGGCDDRAERRACRRQHRSAAQSIIRAAQGRAEDPAPCILHAAARLTCGCRQRRLRIQASWPWADGIVTAWDRISALSQAP